MDVAVAHHVCAIEPAPGRVAGDRRVQAGAGGGVDLGADVDHQRIEIPPWERGGRRHGIPRGQVGERERRARAARSRRPRASRSVHRSSPTAPNTWPPGCQERMRRPRRILADRWRRRRDAVLAQPVGELDRQLRRRARTPDPHDDVAGTEQGVHADPQRARAREDRAGVRRPRRVPARHRHRRPAGRRTAAPASVNRPRARRTPGLRRPVGSNWCLIRLCSSTIAGSTSAGGAADSWCTTPTPISATKRPVPGSSASRPAAATSDRRPAGRRADRRRAGRAPPPAPRRRRGAPRAAPTPTLPSHSTDVGRYSRGNSSNGSVVGDVPLLERRRAAACAGSPRRGSRACRASPTSSRHRSKPLTFLTVGPPALTTSPSALTYRAWSTVSRIGPYPSRRIPLRPTASAPPTVPVGGIATACPCSASAVVELVDRHAGAALHRHLLGLDPVDAGRAPSPRGPRRPVRPASTVRRS